MQCKSYQGIHTKISKYESIKVDTLKEYNTPDDDLCKKNQ